MSRVVILCGPSCVGKSPLAAALERLYPRAAEQLRPLVLYNSRRPRPKEKDGVDYHFRSRQEIEALRDDGDFRVIEARADLQAVSLAELAITIEGGADPFFEGNPFVAVEIVRAAGERSLPVLSVFMSPLSSGEIVDLRRRHGARELADLVFELMKRKLLRRARKEKGEPSDRELRDIHVRARSAYRELAMAHRFQHVLPNHDGEDSDNWELFEALVGDAARALDAFAELLGGTAGALLEQWDDKLIPEDL